MGTVESLAGNVNAEAGLGHDNYRGLMKSQVGLPRPATGIFGWMPRIVIDHDRIQHGEAPLNGIGDTQCCYRDRDRYVNYFTLLKPMRKCVTAITN
jgi:hypothetical protein